MNNCTLVNLTITYKISRRNKNTSVQSDVYKRIVSVIKKSNFLVLNDFYLRKRYNIHSVQTQKLEQN